MIIPQKYLAVNWADGMKVNKDHFVGTENFVVDNLRDVASIHVNQLNFGLLPPLSGSGALLSDYEVIKTATNQLQIRIDHCQAITTGGVRISIMGEGLTENVDVARFDANDMPDEQNENESSTRELYVVIIVDPFKRSLHGHPDPEEIPIRHPFTRSTYAIELKNSNEIATNEMGGYHLIIGKVNKTGNSLVKDQSFIPPCSTITSSRTLIDYYNSFCSILNELQNISFQIVQKINYKNQRSVIAQNVKEKCRVILSYSSDHYFYMRNIIPSLPPVYLLNAISVLANKLYSFLNIIPENEKEELLNYFFEWSDITQMNFLKMLSIAIEVNYDHHNSGVYFERTLRMMRDILTIWQKLNTLEFIGQHKENIVVKEEVLMNTNKDKKGWSILD